MGTVALIIVLSAFNGLESLVNGFYNTFDPDLKVTPATGKYFKADESKLRQLSQLKGVSAVSTVLEERVLFTYRDMEHIGSIKGVDASYSAVTRIRSAVGHGEYAVFPEKQGSARALPPRARTPCWPRDLRCSPIPGPSLARRRL